MKKTRYKSILHSTLAALVSVGLSVGSLTVLPPSVQAAALGYNGKILFDSNRNGNYDIYVMNADGSGLVNITDNPAEDAVGSWSPDGSKIVFISDRDGNKDIYTMNADGSNVERVTNTPASTEHTPKWSPDGSKILYARQDAGVGWEIYVTNPDGSDQTNLTNNSNLDIGASWSPDGSKIVFDSNRDGSRDIYVMNPDGSHVVRLTHHPALDTNPSWSPDGTKISFNSRRNGNPDIYTMNVDGSDLNQLTDDVNNDWAIKWSPDSSKIIWQRAFDDPSQDIATVDSIGGEFARLTGPNSGANRNPDWQPVPNTPPATSPDTLTTPYDKAGTADVLANDTDEEALDGQYLTIKTQPLNGTASVVEGKVKYTPNDGYHGSDQLTYQICDSFLLDQKCSTGVLAVTVQAPGAPAVIVTKVGEVNYQDGTAKYSTTSKRPTFSGTASPGATIKVEIHSDPILLTTSAGDDGHWSVSPTADLPAGEHTVYISATLNGVTTELDSFVLGISETIPNTGTDTWPLRGAGVVLLAAGVAVGVVRRRSSSRSSCVPPLFPHS